MSRTVVNIPITQDVNQLHEKIRQILITDGYNETNYKNNEIVWKKGVGFFTAMHFIKLDYQANVLYVSGWICSGIGSFTFGEHALNGFYGVIPKKSVQGTIDKITAAAGFMPNA